MKMLSYIGYISVYSFSNRPTNNLLGSCEYLWKHLSYIWEWRYWHIVWTEMTKRIVIFLSWLICISFIFSRFRYVWVHYWFRVFVNRGSLALLLCFDDEYAWTKTLKHHEGLSLKNLFFFWKDEKKQRKVLQYILFSYKKTIITFIYLEPIS